MNTIELTTEQVKYFKQAAEMVNQINGKVQSALEFLMFTNGATGEWRFNSEGTKLEKVAPAVETPKPKVKHANR